MQVLTVRQQIRREREDIGPRSELVYWRRCLAKYTSIIEHLKSPVCQNCIVILVLSKSKLLAVRVPRLFPSHAKILHTFSCVEHALL